MPFPFRIWFGKMKTREDSDPLPLDLAGAAISPAGVWVGYVQDGRASKVRTKTKKCAEKGVEEFGLLV